MKPTCKHCGSKKIVSIDNQPLSHSEGLKDFDYPKYDNEIYVEFLCEDCGEKSTHHFSLVLPKVEYEVNVVLIPVGAMSNGRRLLERIENQKFNNREAVENAICFNEDDPMAVEDLRILALSDFMDMCNNSDDDTPENEKIDLVVTWIGYVQIKEK